MEKFTAKNTLSFTFDASHKGAPYTIDGGAHYMNGGDFAEVAFKHALGLPAVKDGNGDFRKVSDVPSLSMSVKSSRGTLTSVKLGNSFDEVITNFFPVCASSCFAWVVLVDDTISAYIMNADEFKEFIITWGRYDADRHVIRFKITSAKMLAWLESRCH